MTFIFPLNFSTEMVGCVLALLPDPWVEKSPQPIFFPSTHSSTCTWDPPTERWEKDDVSGPSLDFHSWPNQIWALLVPG